LKKPYSEDLPYGDYSLDRKTKKLYLSPIDLKELNALDNSYFFLKLLPYLTSAVAVFYRERIGAFIANSSTFDNALLLLGLLIAVFLLLFWNRRKHFEPRKALTENAGYFEVVCEPKKEKEFLRWIIKKYRNICIFCVLSVFFTPVFGYGVIVISHMMPIGLAIVPFIIFILPAVGVALCLLTLRLNISTIAVIKSRITILDEGEHND